MAYDEDLDDDSPSSSKRSGRRRGSAHRGMKRERPEVREQIVQEMIASTAPVVPGQIFSVQAGNNGRHLDETIEVALWKAAGRITFAAGWLGMKRTALQERIKDSERLQEVIQDIEEMRLDNAEMSLDALMAAGSEKVVMFLLKTKGKQRGWAETKTPPNGNMITIDAARELEGKLMGAVGGLRDAMISQMKSGAVDAKILPAPTGEPVTIDVLPDAPEDLPASSSDRDASGAPQEDEELASVGFDD